MPESLRQTQKDTATDMPLQAALVAPPSAFVPALGARLLPLVAFALAWIFTGPIPFAVATAEWGA